MNCPKCGATLPEQTKFCGVCGYQMTEAEMAAAAGPAPEGATVRAAGAVQAAHPGAPAEVFDTMAGGIVSGAISAGWRAFKERAGLLLGMVILLMVFNIVFGGLVGYIFKENSGALSVINSLWQLFQNVFTGGIYLACLRVVRGDETSIGDFFAGFGKFIPLFVSGFLVAVAVALGMVLLIIPGVIIYLGVSQWIFMIMDQDAGVFDSLSKSWELMKGYKVSFLLLVLAFLGINLLGALALVVGLLVTVPWTLASLAAFYHRVRVENEAEVS